MEVVYSDKGAQLRLKLRPAFELATNLILSPAAQRVWRRIKYGVGKTDCRTGRRYLDYHENDSESIIARQNQNVDDDLIKLSKRLKFDFATPRPEHGGQKHGNYNITRSDFGVDWFFDGETPPLLVC